MSQSNRYLTTFYSEIKEEDDSEKLKDALYSWVRQLHNPDWPICGFGKTDQKTVYFLIESMAPLDITTHSSVRNIFQENGYPVVTSHLVPPHPAT